MKRCELLSPAGNMTMLKYAVMYGADAVYLAGTKFGARKFADNFDHDALKEAVNFAHLYGVKVYITINTLVYENEIEEFLDYVKYLSSIGIDAALVQDFGMLNAIRKVSPSLELHASTQMHNNGASVLNLLSSIGVKRAVLDREMSIDEIKNLPSDIEKEVFCHGALCVSYSGQCLFSSLILNRSGNRGECAGLCRLCYKKRCVDGSIKEGYYLSLKDLSTIDSLDKILDQGIDCIKIEGRMKSPEYVGYMTKIYRELLDSYYEGNLKKVTKEERKNIELLFNRGLTQGYINNTKNEDMGNSESSNHIGIHLGYYKLTNKKIELKLEESLSQGDTIRFKEDSKGMLVNFLYDKKDNLISKANAGDIVYVDNFLELEHSGELRKVGSIDLEKEIHNLPSRFVYIDASISIKCGNSMKLSISDGVNHIESKGSIVELAQSRPITKEDIHRQISKTGSTIYKIRNLDVDMDDNAFVSLRDINELRRDALERLNEARTNKPSLKVDDYKRENIETTKTKPKLIVCVSNKEQYLVASKYTSEIYSSNDELLKEFNDINPIYIDSNNITSKKFMISDLGSLLYVKGNEVITSYMLNATNSETVNSILKYGVSNVTLSIELGLEDIISMKNKVDYSKVATFIYGKVNLMKMKYDPIKEGETLIDRNNKEYQIKRDKKYNYLMSFEALDRTNLIDDYKKLGVGCYVVEFFQENSQEIDTILVNICKKIYKE